MGALFHYHFSTSVMLLFMFSFFVCVVCFLPSFPRYPHPSPTGIAPPFLPSDWCGIWEVQLSNQGNPSLHLISDWCGTCSTPPDLHLTAAMPSTQQGDSHLAKARIKNSCFVFVAPLPPLKQGAINLLYYSTVALCYFLFPQRAGCNNHQHGLLMVKCIV